MPREPEVHGLLALLELQASLCPIPSAAMIRTIIQLRETQVAAAGAG